MATTPVTVALGSTINYLVQPATTKSLTTVTITRWIDRPADKVVLVWIQELPTPITLWSGAAYTAIGDWTNAQAEAQLIAVLSGTAGTSVSGVSGVSGS